MTNNKQQTAVEWYDNEIGKLFDQFTMGKIKIYEFQNQRFKLEKQAKEMEKRQIISAHNANFNYDKWPSLLPTLGDQYYNETYGGGEQ